VLSLLLTGQQTILSDQMKVGDANALNCHTIILMEGQAKKIHEIRYNEFDGNC